MLKQLDLVKEAKKLPYDLRKNFLLQQKETTIHKLLLSLIHRLGDKYSAEITHSKDEHGRDLVVRERDPLGGQYIGVIVKKGDSKGKLTGRTAREIDEVISQAKQAISHRCPLHELEAGVVKINQLWIFFIGRLTSTASERIEIELKDTSKRVFALEQTIDLFTNNYPEIFFNPVLAEFVQTNISRIESLSLTLDKTKSFETKYINPWVCKWENAGEITEALSNVIYTQKMPFQKLADIVSSGQRIILTGDPGVGKTTALKIIATNMIKNNFMLKTKDPTRGPLEVPILIKAKELLEKTPDEIYKEFMTVPELEEQISIQTLLIDGLDEIHIDKRHDCIETAMEFADKFKSGLVITCRKIPMIVTILSPFNRYELLPLDYVQAITFVEQAIKDKRLIEILKEGILRDELKIQFTPLALELLIEVVTYEKEVPASLAEIFERYTDVTCGKYDKGRGIESVFEHHVKKRFLAELAWNEFYLKGLLEIPRESFELFIKTYSKKYRWDEDTFKNFIAEIERSGMLRIDDQVRFWHRSFLDFFIALRISEKRTEYPTLNEDIVNIYFDDTWTDVAFYYVGIQRELNPEIILGIAEYPSDDFGVSVYKVLIGRLLQAGWHTIYEEKVKAIGIGLQSIEDVRNHVDRLLSPQKTKLPEIFSDFFYMALSEYSYGSRTMLVETNSVCDSLITSCDLTSLRNCLLLLWAQRSRLLADEREKRAGQMLDVLSSLEIEGKLLIRDKFVSLFILDQIERDNPKVLRSIRRKIKRTKKLYPGEMRRLLPPPRSRVRLSFMRKRDID